MIVQFPGVRMSVALPHRWRIGDMGLCGSSLVQVAALDGDMAMVVGQGRFGNWAIWMEAAKLKRTELWDYEAPAFLRRLETPPEPANHPA